jgi:hypothetical protein
MVHYTCDCCKRPIDPDRELRYVVRVEVYASLDPVEEELDDDRDYLQEIQDILEQIDDAAQASALDATANAGPGEPDESESETLGDNVYHLSRHDLCSECRQRFVKNPLARATRPELGFSLN